jgi:Protein of unknown function (DUF2939)
MNKLVAGGICLIALLGGTYFGSPYYAAYNLRNAAIEGDKDKLEASVDFPAVRDGLKSQMSAAMMTQFQNDPKMKDNPFAGLAAVMMPTIIDKAIDAYVTPDGIAAMVQGKKLAGQANQGTKSAVETESDYVGLDRFRVRIKNTDTQEAGLSMLFERRGFATWKLIKMELPADMLKKSQ